MSTIANNQPGKLPAKEIPCLIKRMPRRPRNQPAIVLPRSEELVIDAKIAAVAKQLHLTTMEIIQKTLSENYHHAAIGTSNGIKSKGSVADLDRSYGSQIR
jgi:hypothetical protein